MTIKNASILIACMAICQICFADQFIKYPAATSSSSGTVTSVAAGTGLSGGTITTSGTIALTVPVVVSSGGTNATTAAGARTSLGAAASGANVDITSLGTIAKLFPATNSITAIQVDKADGSTNVLNIDTTNARLGIGTVAPDDQLTIDGGSLDTRTGNGVVLIQNNSTDYGPELKLNNVNSGRDWIFISAGNSDTAGNGNFALQDGGNVRLFIDTSGNVGLGTTTAGAKLTVNGTAKLGAAGVAFTAAGGCTVASTTLSTTATDLTCTGVPASVAVSVICSGQAAMTTATADGLYCRAKGTADTITCNTLLVNAVAMAFSCSWIQP